MELICEEIKDDRYLLYTTGIRQFFDGERFITILGEYHNVNKNIAPGVSEKQVDYVYNDLSPSLSDKTFIMIELPDERRFNPSNIASINLFDFASANRRITTAFVDDRFQIFDVDRETQGLYMDIVRGEALQFCWLTGRQFIMIRNNIQSFFDFMYHNSQNFPDHFRQLIISKTVEFHQLLQTIYQALKLNKISDENIIEKMDEGRNRGETPKSFTILVNVRPQFYQIQQYILDINILYHLYNESNRFNNFVIVVGNHHLLQLSKYFSDSGATLLREANGIEENHVNLKGTLKFSTIEACINSLKLVNPGNIYN